MPSASEGKSCGAMCSTWCAFEGTIRLEAFISNGFMNPQPLLDIFRLQLPLNEIQEHLQLVIPQGEGHPQQEARVLFGEFQAVLSHLAKKALFDSPFVLRNVFVILTRVLIMSSRLSSLQSSLISMIFRSFSPLSGSDIHSCPWPSTSGHRRVCPSSSLKAWGLATEVSSSSSPTKAWPL